VKELEHHQRKSESFLSPEAGVDFNTVEPHLFRSRVLNPILQRQLADSGQTSQRWSRRLSGQPWAARTLPLSGPPSPQSGQEDAQESPLHFTRSVQLGLFQPGSLRDSWEKILHNTTFMQNNRAEYLAGAWDEEMLYDFEIEIIRLEILWMYTSP